MAKLGDDLETHIDESRPFIENLGDLSALIEHGCLTVAQCALTVPAYLSRKQGYHDEMYEHYYVLACVDIARGDLIARHPTTRLPYSQYMRMMEAGVFGKDGEDTPIPTAAWLVSLDDAEKWLHSKGVPVPVNFDKLRADLDKQKQPEKSIPQPVANWKMRIQAQAAILWRATIATGATPTKNNIKTDLAKWCRENNVTSDSGIFPSQDYIYRHVLRHWSPPMS